MARVPLSGIVSRDLSPEDAWEELTKGLAAEEAGRLNHIFQPVGNPDAGVECLTTAPSGSVVGWQAKFFTETIGDPQIAQMRSSANAVLDKRPNVDRLRFVLPRDPSNPKVPGRTDEQQRLDKFKLDVQLAAQKRGRVLLVEFWFSAQVTAAMRATQVGRALDAYWYGQNRFLLEESLESSRLVAIARAGTRFQPDKTFNTSTTEALATIGDSSAAIADLNRELSSAGEALDYATRQVGNAGANWRTTFSAAQSLVRGAIARRSLQDLETAVNDLRSLAQNVASVRAPQRKVAEAVGRARARLDRLVSVLLTSPTPMLVSPIIWVQGDGGSGKTHELCTLVQSLPSTACVLFHAGAFEVNGKHSLEELIAGKLGFDAVRSPGLFWDCVQLHAAAMGRDFVVAVDAMNEAGGWASWSGLLAGLPAELAGRPGIRVVASVRSEFVSRILPKNVGCVLRHQGFVGRSNAAVASLCAAYSLDFNNVGPLGHLLENPLFVHELCAAFKRQGRSAFDNSTYSVSELLQIRLEALAHDINLDPDSVQNATPLLAALVDQYRTQVVTEGRTWVDRPTLCQRLAADPRVADSTSARRLVQTCVEEGFLVSLPGVAYGDELVSFSFERYAHHEVASELLRSMGPPNGPPEDQAAWSELLLEEVTGIPSSLAPGVEAALSVLLPVKHGLELADLIESGGVTVDPQVFLASVEARPSTAVTAAAKRRVRAMFENGGPGVVSLFLRVALSPGHPLNAAYLSSLLLGLDRADRDVLWGGPVFFELGQYEPERLHALFDWGAASDLAEIRPEVAHLFGTVLCWLLLSPNRWIRDGASVALTGVFAEVPKTVSDAMKLAIESADLGIEERVWVAAAGASLMVEGWQGVTPVVRSRVVELPPHASLVGAAHLCVVAAGESSLATAVEEKRFDMVCCPRLPEDFDRDPNVDPAISSSIGGFSDFSRYVVGRFFGGGWAAFGLRRHDGQLYTFDDCKAEVRRWALDLDGTEERLRELGQALAAGAKGRPDWLQAGADFELAYMWETEPELRKLISVDWPIIEEARSKLSTVLGVRTDREPQFPQSVAELLVAERAAELCGADERQRRFDANGLFRQGRSRLGELERIGKRYQWWALNEVLARVATNLIAIGSGLSPSTRPVSLAGWRGTRDLDPTSQWVVRGAWDSPPIASRKMDEPDEDKWISERVFDDGWVEKVLSSEQGSVPLMASVRAEGQRIQVGSEEHTSRTVFLHVLGLLVPVAKSGEFLSVAADSSGFKSYRGLNTACATLSRVWIGEHGRGLPFSEAEEEAPIFGVAQAVVANLLAKTGGGAPSDDGEQFWVPSESLVQLAGWRLLRSGGWGSAGSTQCQLVRTSGKAEEGEALLVDSDALSQYVLAVPRVDTSAAGRSILATPAVGSYFAELRRAKSQGSKASLRSTA